MFSTIMINYVQKSSQPYYYLFLICLIILNVTYLFSNSYNEYSYIQNMNYPLIILTAYLPLHYALQLKSNTGFGFPKKIYSTLNPIHLLHNYIAENTTKEDRILSLTYDISIYTEINRKTCVNLLSYEHFKALRKFRSDFIDNFIKNIQENNIKYIICSYKSFDINEISKQSGIIYEWVQTIGIYHIYKNSGRIRKLPSKKIIESTTEKPSFIRYDSLNNYRIFNDFHAPFKEEFIDIITDNHDRLITLLKAYGELCNNNICHKIYLYGATKLTELLLQHGGLKNVSGIIDILKPGINFQNFTVEGKDILTQLSPDTVVLICTHDPENMISKELTTSCRGMTIKPLYQELSLLSFVFAHRYDERRVLSYDIPSSPLKEYLTL